MTLQLSSEQKQVLAKDPEKPLAVQDPDTRKEYVIVQMDVFKRLQNALTYDDSDITANEMMAAAKRMLDDPAGWGAPGMEVYDNYQPPQYDPPRQES